ncbi:AraC family transcriptional regulator [Frondihabitans cladoniiphilus]|uniref:AraC family transcriptional regulator n=1 Tax=Frondihabitans cladoniiphilus TaxID=715785 RepID=A0ABP8WA18_9MICO
MDLLSNVLTLSGVSGTLGARIEAADSWGVRWEDVRGSAFYAVTSGTAWLGLADREPILMMPGDVVLLPSGSPHSLTSDAGSAAASCDAGAAEHARVTGGLLRFGTGAVQTHILGAGYRHDPLVDSQILALLPEVVHIRGDNGGSCLGDTVRLLARELASPQIGTEVVLNSLVDVLLVQLLRAWLATRPSEAEGTILGVLGDPLLSVALTRLHSSPERPWTTELLAAELAVSRATLARRFAARLGESPGAYLTRLRMDLAAVRLRDGDDPLEAIAASVGYTSVYAFNRAFSRARAVAPGRFRAQVRSAGRVA